MGDPERPSLSVLVPVRDGERYLEEAIRSVLAEGWEPIEVLVVDDGSTDGGVKVIEALAAGLPVVASAHGAFPELLDDGRAGLLHRPGDPADLARAIGELLADPVRAAALGTRGHALARERHAAAAMAAAHERLYASL